MMNDQQTKVRDGCRLVRRHRLSCRLHFDPPILCPCLMANLFVIDYRHPRFPPKASREFRYEVTCDACLCSDPNGYATRKQVLAAITVLKAGRATSSL